MTPPVSFFLALISALSAAVQTVIDHVFKGHCKWLDEPKSADREEAWRRTAIHALSAVLGFGLALSVHLQPLKCLNAGRGAENYIVNAVVTGLMVSFGSSLSNEALDAIRTFKKVQEGLRHAQLGPSAPVPQRFVS